MTKIKLMKNNDTKLVKINDHQKKSFILGLNDHQKKSLSITLPLCIITVDPLYKSKVDSLTGSMFELLTDLKKLLLLILLVINSNSKIRSISEPFRKNSNYHSNYKNNYYRNNCKNYSSIQNNNNNNNNNNIYSDVGKTAKISSKLKVIII
ncbi:hypothetical protein H8356DRAFT_1360378 [Neocallimastix lanati (nom. inval.)]|nr:hypothetical protein H8356DRAFT_1360378 [Neocallimastix sp. JGI-2020a]